MTSYRKKLFLLISLTTLARLLLASWLELGNDEAYYWTYALHLQWNYFDHPPLIGWLIRLSTLNLCQQSEFFVRAGAPLLAGINTWIIAATARRLGGERAGWYAALIYNASLYSSLIAGVFILPDTPQTFFWVWSVYLLVRLVTEIKEDKKRTLMLLFGLTAGLAMMSKVQAVFLWFGWGWYVLLYDRSWLKRGSLYLSALISLLLISPILIWNIREHFVTYSFHSSRVSPFHQPLRPESLLTEWGGEWFYHNPLLMLLYSALLVGIFRKKIRFGNPASRILILTGTPLIVLVWCFALFNDTLPHWSAPGFYGWMILAAWWLGDVRIFVRVPKAWLRLLPAWALVLQAVIWILGSWFIKAAPFPMGSVRAADVGKGDVTLEMFGYRQLENKFAAWYRSDSAIRQGAVPFILADKWYLAAHLDYYVARPLRLTLRGWGAIPSIHHYHWLNRVRPSLYPGANAYYLNPADDFTDPSSLFKDNFTRITLADSLIIRRAGIPVRKFYIYRLSGFRPAERAQPGEEKPN